MFNHRMSLVNVAFALSGLFLLVQSVASFDANNLTCDELQPQNLITQQYKRDRISWDITLSGSMVTTMLRCYKFSLLPKQNFKKLQWEVSPNQQNKKGKMKYLMLFLTKSEIQIPNQGFNITQFLENRLNGQAIASSLNGLYSYQDFAKLYYEEKEEGTIQTYYVYIYYFINKFMKIEHTDLSLLDQSLTDYQMSLILNPEVKDLCEGYSNEQNICKCEDKDKITQYCNVDVVYLGRSDSHQKINPKKFRESLIFLYLNHTELFQDISEEKRFKLNIKQLSDHTDHEMAVYEKFIEKQDFNDILPMKEFFLEERMNKKIIESPKNFELTIQKEKKDRIFYVYVNQDTFEIEVSLTIINEVKNPQSGNLDQIGLNGKMNNNKEEQNRYQSKNKNIKEGQFSCQELCIKQSTKRHRYLTKSISLNKEIGFNCFTFELAASQDSDTFLLALSKGLDDERNYKKNILLFVTKEKINAFSYDDFVMNKYKDQGFTFALDQLYTHKQFPKLYYSEKDEEQNRQSTKNKRYYIYIYSLNDDKMNFSNLNSENQSPLDYKLKLILNPQDKDISNGFTTKDSECKDNNYITLDCDIKVVKLHDKKGSTFIIKPEGENNFENYLYLNHDELYSGISEKKKFKLILKSIGTTTTINKFAVFDEFIGKHEINEILPIKKFAVEINRDKPDPTIYQEEFEFIITKQMKDRIFYIKSNGKLFDL